MKKLTCLSFCLLIGSANAAIIDFEDVAVASGTNSDSGDLTSGGFSFDLLADHSHLANNNASGNSGSTFLIVDNYSGPNALNLSATSGATFSLSSIDLGEVNPVKGLATEVSLIGNLLGGGILNATITLDGIVSSGGSNNFETFALGWTNLTDVTFTATAGSGDHYWAIDNINTASVPEPATLALIGLGLAGIRLSRKTKNT